VANSLLSRDAIKFGPKMLALNPRQQAFVVIMWERQPISQTQATIEAGYAYDPSKGHQGRGSAEVQGTRLMANPLIREAMIEYGHSKMTGDAPAIYHQLLQVAQEPQHKDMVKAGLALFGRAGFHEAIEKNVNVTVTLTDEQKIEKIRRLAQTHGIPVENVLPDAVDVEFHDVTDEDDRLKAYLEGPEDEY
jgi:hypothetical protein